MPFRFLIIILLAFPLLGRSQQFQITGQIQDADNKSPVSYSSVYFQESAQGQTTDSLGRFSITVNQLTTDTLLISHVGYQPLRLPLLITGDTTQLIISLTKAAPSNGVTVVAKFNKGLYLWSKIMARKHLYNPDLFVNYGFTEYNKLHLNVKNVNIDKLKDNLLFKPFSFIINPIAGMKDDKGNLPGYLMETLSEYAYQRNPHKTREYIMANNTHGMLPPNMYNLLGVLKQKMNPYDNFVRILNRDFISPFYENADNCYIFSVPDTEVINGIKYLQLYFKPKRSGLNGFEGYVWVRHGTYEIRDIHMKLNANATVSFIDAISFDQTFIQIKDSLPFLQKQRVIADFRLAGKKSLTVTGAQTTSYNHIVVNSDSLSSALNTQTVSELITKSDDYSKKSNDDWQSLRPDSLNTAEKRDYYVIDSFVHSAGYAKAQRSFKFLGTGYWETGNVDMGKWYNLISANQWEGTRIRLDLSTNLYFNRNLFLHGYLAYGTKDNVFKGLAEAYWVPKREPSFLRLHASFKQDVDNNVRQYAEIGDDNVFSLAIRKPNNTRKFIAVRDIRLEAYQRWKSGLSVEMILAHQEYTPLQNLPSSKQYSVSTGKVLTGLSLGLKVRFAYLEKYVIGDYFKYTLDNKYPVITLMAEKGFSGILNSGYDYFKSAASISDELPISPYGKLNVDLFAGKIYGTLPFTLLENHPGNDMYYYSDRFFNMMYRFEYLSDQYAGFRFQHRLGWSVFRVFPFMRKLKWGQFWTVNGLWGSLTEANRQANQADNFFKTLNGRSYFEAGTGIENIFKVFRIDCIWRYLPQPLPIEKKLTFGVFGSVQFRI